MRGDEHSGANLRQKVYAGTKSSFQLDRYVQQMLENDVTSLCGVLVSGNTGTGKTFYVENCLQKFEQSHPILRARHYQQHQNIPAR